MLQILPQLLTTSLPVDGGHEGEQGTVEDSVRIAPGNTAKYGDAIMSVLLSH